MMNTYLFSRLRWAGLFLAILTTGVFISCNDDDPEPSLFANFSTEASSDNFLQVNFTDLSDGATSWSWDFGDNSGTSTEQNPTYTYSAAGTYSVTLTISSDNDTDTFSSDVVIVDPDEALTLLTGTTSKTWSLVREGTAMLLAADPEFSQIYWPGSSNNGERPCLYDDTFTFSRDGGYTYNDGGTFWAEFGVFNGGADVTGCDSNTTPESCFDAVASNMVNECGEDVSAWLSGSHSFEYDASNGTITLTGMGAWIGIPKLGTSGENAVPQSNVTFNVVLREGGTSGVDTMYVNFDYAGAFWPITYVSYSDGATQPDLVSLNASFSFENNGREISFTNTSSGGATSYSWDFGDDSGTSTEENPVYTYAEDGTYNVTLDITDGSSSATVTREVAVVGSVPAPDAIGHTFVSADGADYLSVIGGASPITLGVTDPAGSGDMVGQLDRTDAQFQEAILTGDPQAKFRLSNFNTMTIDVYFPSSNDYSGDLTQGLVIGFSNQTTSDGGRWWEVQSQWSANDLATDTWHTLTFDLTNAPEGGSTGDATSREDLDMFFLGIGGGNHFDQGTFYIRNLSLSMQ